MVGALVPSICTPSAVPRISKRTDVSGHAARVCRGCAMVLAGVAIGLLAGPLFAATPMFLMIGASGILLLSLLRLGPGRPSKWRTPIRSCGCAGLGDGRRDCRARSPIGLAVATGAIVAFGVVWLAYRRRQPDRTPCLTCAERTLPIPCRGVKAIVQSVSVPISG